MSLIRTSRSASLESVELFVLEGSQAVMCIVNFIIYRICTVFSFNNWGSVLLELQHFPMCGWSVRIIFLKEVFLMCVRRLQAQF